MGEGIKVNKVEGTKWKALSNAGAAKKGK